MTDLLPPSHAAAEVGKTFGVSAVAVIVAAGAKE